MDIPPQPAGFEALCERVGLSIMLGQKVQFALAGYFAAYSRVKLGVDLPTAKAQMEKHLSKPMGVVIADIEAEAPLVADTWSKVKAFQGERNWLVHDFDEEATPFLSQGERIAEYSARMEAIAHAALELMTALDAEGNALVAS